jgi:hypothetical protein
MIRKAALEMLHTSRSINYSLPAETLRGLYLLQLRSVVLTILSVSFSRKDFSHYGTSPHNSSDAA